MIGKTSVGNFEYNFTACIVGGACSGLEISEANVIYSWLENSGDNM